MRSAFVEIHDEAIDSMPLLSLTLWCQTYIQINRIRLRDPLARFGTSGA
jgi:hypothetical protein